MQLYADEDFSYPVVEELRRLGHDVITAQEDQHGGQRDEDILKRAHELRRAVLTHNRRHYERLHKLGHAHHGIVSATQDPKHDAELAQRIDVALSATIAGRWTLRVNRPQRPRKRSTS